MTEITVVQGDFGYDLNFTLQNADGDIFDLSGVSSMLFRAQVAGTISLKFSGSMSIVSPAAGTCKYTVASGNFRAAQTYSAEIQCTFSTGAIVTFSDIQIIVEPKIPF